MLIQETQNISILEFKIFKGKQRLKHGVLKRRVGESAEAFSSFNIRYEHGDNRETLDKNMKNLQQILPRKITLAKQVHGETVVSIHGKNWEDEHVCDGFMTNQNRLVLGIKHADCQAAIFYDPVTHALANIHCGWRGSVANIYQKTLLVMKENYGTKAENVLIGIGPSLGPSHAEFKNYKVELPEKFWEYKDTKDNFNFWEITKKQLLDAGVLDHHIEIANICTYANKKDYFSYRRDGTCGRHVTFCYLI